MRSWKRDWFIPNIKCWLTLELTTPECDILFPVRYKLWASGDWGVYPDSQANKTKCLADAVASPVFKTLFKHFNILLHSHYFKFKFNLLFIWFIYFLIFSGTRDAIGSQCKREKTLLRVNISEMYQVICH